MRTAYAVQPGSAAEQILKDVTAGRNAFGKKLKSLNGENMKNEEFEARYLKKKRRDQMFNGFLFVDAEFGNVLVLSKSQSEAEDRFEEYLNTEPPSPTRVSVALPENFTGWEKCTDIPSLGKCLTISTEDWC